MLHISRKGVVLYPCLYMELRIYREEPLKILLTGQAYQEMYFLIEAPQSLWA